MLSTVKQIVLAHVRRQKIKFDFMYQNTQKSMTMRNQRASRYHLVLGPCCSQSYLAKNVFSTKIDGVFLAAH